MREEEDDDKERVNVNAMFYLFIIIFPLLKRVMLNWLISKEQ